MTNLPFGFGLPGDNSDDDGSSGPGGMPPGFDMGQLGAMLSQLGQMMSSATPSSGPVNYDLARQVAVKGLGGGSVSQPVAAVDQAAVRDAGALVEVWLDGATTFPAGATSFAAWTPTEWVERTMPTWQQLVSPVAGRMGSAVVEGLPAELRDQVGPMLGMLTSMSGMAYGSQLGSALTQLAGEVLTSSDIGIPLGPDRVAAVLPKAMAQFGANLGLDEDQVRLYLCAREAAHHRLFHGVPWLKDKIIAMITEHASHTTVDLSAAQELMGNFDPSKLGELQQAMGATMMTPAPTPAQQRIEQRLETLLALIEGWVDTVVAGALGDRMPSSAALAETLRRRRAAGGPAEQTFEALIGVQLRPRKLRTAAQLWRLLGESRGTDGRDTLWSDYDLLPTDTDLDAPDEFVARDKQFNELLASLEDVPSMDDAGNASVDPDRPAADHTGPSAGLGDGQSDDDDRAASGTSEPPD